MLRARIIIADDHFLLRAGLRRLLDGHADLRVVAEAEDGREAVELCRRLRPELVLMDVHMPTTDGITATREIKRELPLTIVLMLTALEDPALLSEALRAGAGGYILKSASNEEMVGAIRGALSGEVPINPTVGAQLLMRLYTQAPQQEPADLAQPPAQPSASPAEERTQPPLLASLTPREEEVLRLIARGLTNQQIANDLGVSLNTVKKHARRVITKLNVSDRTQAAVLAVRLGLRGVNAE
jgi:RNA polymerase sigma factor (sigma-70 family)